MRLLRGSDTALSFTTAPCSSTVKQCVIFTPDMGDELVYAITSALPGIPDTMRNNMISWVSQRDETGRPMYAAVCIYNVDKYGWNFKLISHRDAPDAKSGWVFALHINQGAASGTEAGEVPQASSVEPPAA